MMGVYIKMDFPKTCSLCGMEHETESVYGHVVSTECTLLDDAYTLETRFCGRLDNCPLAEVKEPHGDLIERDRLLTERMKSKYYHLSNGDVAIPMVDIRRAPTVIERSEDD